MKLDDFCKKIVYISNGKRISTTGDDAVAFSEIKIDNGRLTVSIHSSKAVELVSCSLIYARKLDHDEKFFVNGYQSWTVSREYGIDEEQKGLLNVCKLKIAEPFAAASGDYRFTQYGKNLFHSFTYTYFRRGDSYDLFGTLNDRNGYTIFYVDKAKGDFEIRKDLEGVTLNGEMQVFDIFRTQGTYDAVFDEYFAAYPAKNHNRVGHLAGYTSWYNYFQNIDEQIILRDLKGMHERIGEKAQIFQIDDGYETFVGDWQAVDGKKFPNGMKPIADEVHKCGYLAGIWLAPFGAEFKSQTAKNHPEWLIKDAKGKPYIAGFAWGGFYALDIELPEVRAYIKGFFDTVFDDWGYDMVKLDFLYAACMYPRNGKSRGQLMHEAMDFLRECCRDKIILGCGVPLGPAWGIVDACRVTCDAELSYANKYYVHCTNQEIVSTKNSINDTLFRRHMNDRIFANDPDVFFLRRDGMKPVSFTLEQRKLHAKINHIFGHVLFVSDNIGAYDDDQIHMLLKAYAPFEGSVKSVTRTADVFTVDYVEKGVSKVLTFNLKTGEYTDKANA